MSPVQVPFEEAFREHDVHFTRGLVQALKDIWCKYPAHVHLCIYVGPLAASYACLHSDDSSCSRT